jgi:hypothetical protein
MIACMTQSAHTGDGITCLVTIHGIGFQQQPDDDAGLAGYADGLHQRLHRLLGDALSDDPHRTRSTPGEHGAVYVQSSWPPESAPAGVRSIELGLRRLGHRADPRSSGLDLTGADLVQPGKHIAHVALIYTPSEETVPDPGSLLEMNVRGLLSLEHYTTLRHAVHTLGADLAAIHHPPQVAALPAKESVPRLDTRHREGLVRRLLHHAHQLPDAAAGPADVLRTVEEDVAAYVARNVLRDRVRDFVREALIRLQNRGDVTRVVVNSHSQGTVLAFDVLRTLPYQVVDLVSDLLTLGSPLRKYALLLDWGRDTGRIVAIPRWTNMWDELDPVADPLSPAPPWRWGDPGPERAPRGLFVDVDPESGVSAPHDLVDVRVDNVHRSAGGLRAHDYWSNVDEVVRPLAERLRAAG